MHSGGVNRRTVCDQPGGPVSDLDFFFVNSEIFVIQIWRGKKRGHYEKFEIAT